MRGDEGGGRGEGGGLYPATLGGFYTHNIKQILERECNRGDTQEAYCTLLEIEFSNDY